MVVSVAGVRSRVRVVEFGSYNACIIALHVVNKCILETGQEGSKHTNICPNYS